MLRLLVLPIWALILSCGAMHSPGTPSPTNSSFWRIQVVDASTPIPEIPAMPKDVYLDFTERVNYVMEGGNPDVLNRTKWMKEKGLPEQNVFYTTDFLLSEMAILTEAAKLLDPNNAKSFNLYLSFRLIRNGRIAKDHIKDTLAPIPSDYFDPETVKYVEPLKRHVSGILLDIQNNQSFCGLDYHQNQFHPNLHQHQSYDYKHHISFPKYARKFGSALFEGKHLKVGVIYNDNQIGCRDIQQQVKDADLHIINLNFYPNFNFPLTYKALAQNLSAIRFKNDNEFLGSKRDYHSKVMFKINFVSSYAIHAIRRDNLYTEEYPDAINVVEKSLQSYFPFLKKFAKRWAEEGRSEIILNPETQEKRMHNEEGYRKDHTLMPYLHAQDVDVNPCQLRTMLGQTADNFGLVAVSEYTWNSFARSRDAMTSAKCPKSLQLPPNPPSTFLIFTSGIGSMWNATQEYFEELFSKHQTISGWYLKTLVFSSEDVKRSAIENKEDSDEFRITLHNGDPVLPEDQGILGFANNMKEKYDIGCLVDFGPNYFENYNYLYFGIVSSFNFTTMKECNPLWDISKIILWSFDLPFSNDLGERLSFDTGSYSVTQKLFYLLVAREIFMKEFPDKEIIFKINVQGLESMIQYEKNHKYYPGYYANNSCMEIDSNINDFYKAMQTWAAINNVKVILPPAYDTVEPRSGLFDIPEEDGSPSKFSSDECVKKDLDMFIRRQR